MVLCILSLNPSTLAYSPYTALPVLLTTTIYCAYYLCTASHLVPNGVVISPYGYPNWGYSLLPFGPLC